MRATPLKSDLERDQYRFYEGVEYKHFWDGLKRSKLDELEHAIVRELLPVSGRRIIDVGCGYGRLADCYLNRFSQVVMVDASMSLLHQAAERVKDRAIYVAADVNHMPFRAAAFDTVLMVRVFHHIPDSQACLAQLHRMLCSNGTLAFTYCNKRNAQRAIKWLAGRTTENPFSAEPAGVGSTVISHHPKAVHRMLLEADFTNLRSYGAGVFDWLAGKLGPLGKWIPPGKRLAGWLGRSKIAPWIFCGAVAQNRPDLIDAAGLEDLLQCPLCGDHLSHNEQGFECLGCKKYYPVEDGIIDLRV